MKHVEVEAVEDRSRAEGGHAVILVHGVKSAPDAVRFRLRPVEAEADGSAAVFDRDLVALSTSVTAEGLALTVGPDIAESPALVPGTAIEIVLPDVGVRGTFPWPYVSPIARPKRRNIMTRRVGAALIATQPVSVQPAGQASGPSYEELAVRVAVLARDARYAEALAVAEEFAALAKKHLGDPMPRSVAPSDGSSALPDQAPPAAVRADAFQNKDADEEANEPLSIPHAGVPAPAESERQSQPPPRRTIIVTRQRQSGRTAPPEPAAEVVGRHAIGPAAAGAAQEQLEPSAAPPRESRIVAEAPTRQVIATPRRETAMPRPTSPAEPVTPDAVQEPMPAPESPPATISQMRAPSGRSVTAGSAAAMAVAVLIAGQIVALRALDLGISKRSAGIEATTRRVAAENLGNALAGMPSVYEVLAAGPKSPRGTAADGVSPARSLQLAHALLHGPEAGRDPEEAIFWLKRYVGGTAGAEHSRIALTQLGSAYAQPVRGQRDFASAKVVWELASAMGDPVAMCFLAAMHEQGLGIPVAPALAGTWYERAAAAGRTCAALPATGYPPATGR